MPPAPVLGARSSRGRVWEWTYPGASGGVALPLEPKGKGARCTLQGRRKILVTCGHMGRERTSIGPLEFWQSKKREQEHGLPLERGMNSWLKDLYTLHGDVEQEHPNSWDARVEPGKPEGDQDETGSGQEKRSRDCPLVPCPADLVVPPGMWWINC